MLKPLLLAGSVLAFSPAALCAPPPNVFQDGDGRVWVHNQTPGNIVRFDFIDRVIERKVTANYCGLIVMRWYWVKDEAPISFPAGNFSWNGQPTTAPGYPVTQTIPACIDNTLSEPRPTNFTTPDGDIVLVNKTPGLSYAVRTSRRSYSRRANNCGYVGFIPPTQYGVGANPRVVITQGGVTSTHPDGTLPIAERPLCVKSGGSYIKMIPQSWL
jgi:hypothetical protein